MGCWWWDVLGGVERRNGAHNGGVSAYKAATRETPQSRIWQLSGFTSAFKGTTVVCCSPVCTQNKLDCYHPNQYYHSPRQGKLILGCNWLLFSLCIFRRRHKNLQDLLRQLPTCHQQCRQLSIRYCNAVLRPHTLTLHSK